MMILAVLVFGVVRHPCCAQVQFIDGCDAPHGHARPALSSTPGGLTPQIGSEFISCPPSGSSSELSSHQMAIRSHPGVQKMPASSISSELSAHQMARPRSHSHT